MISPPQRTLTGMEFVSPELALVDPELRRHLLAIERRSPFHGGGNRPGRALVEPAEERREPETRDARARRAVLSLQWRTAIAIVIVLTCVSFVLGAKLAGSPAEPLPASPSDTQSINQSIISPGRIHETGRPLAGRTSAAMDRPLAWKPVPEATSYEVAIYRNGVRVFHSFSVSPRLDVPSSVIRIGGDGRPATFTWNVWPIRDGHRLSMPNAR